MLGYYVLHMLANRFLTVRKPQLGISLFVNVEDFLHKNSAFQDIMLENMLLCQDKH